MANKNRIRGISIEIDGSTTKLQDAIKELNTQISKTDSALKDVTDRLKLDPGNVDLIRQKQELLTKAVDDTKKKLDQEKEALKQATETAPNYNAWKQANEPIQRAIDETRERLNKLKDQAEKTNAAMAEGKATQDQYDAIQAEIKETEDKLKTLRDERKRVGDEFGNPLSPDQFQALQREISETESTLKSLKDQYKDFRTVASQQLSALGQEMKNFGGKVEDAGRALKPYSDAATGFLRTAINDAIDWESAFTGVKKTVDETVNTTYDDLEQGIKRLSTETASTKEEIAGVAEAAGQLGISADNIVDFTRAMVELGDTTNLSADDAATQLARFINVTGTDQKDVDRLGAAIVDLGNNFATTEADILNMATRLAGAGTQIGLSEGDILGFATALSSVGIEAEMGGSAFSKAMIKMQVAAETGWDKVNDIMARVSEETGETFETFRDFQIYWKNMSGLDKMPIAESLGMLTSEINNLVNSRAELEGFAEVSGVTAQQFIDLYGTSAVEAISLFIQGLGNTEERGESTIQMLQDMGFTEVRLRDTLTRAANASDLFNDAVERGNQAFDENTALNEEAAKRYETTEAKISQTKETISNLTSEIGENALPVVQTMLEFVRDITEGFAGLDEKTQTNIITIGLFIAAASPVLTFLGSILTAFGSLLTLLPLLATPAGIVIGAVMAIGGALVYAYNKFDKFREVVNKFWGWIKDAAKGISDAFKRITGAATDLGGGGGGSFSGGGSVSQTTPVRKFASAYREPAILTSPTIFGTAGGRALVGGDGPGAEVVAGFDLLRDMMTSSMREVLATAGAGGATPPVINLTVDVGGQFFDRRVIQATQRNNFISGGH